MPCGVKDFMKTTAMKFMQSCVAAALASIAAEWGTWLESADNRESQKVRAKEEEAKEKVEEKVLVEDVAVDVVVEKVVDKLADWGEALVSMKHGNASSATRRAILPSIVRGVQIP